MTATDIELTEAKARIERYNLALAAIDSAWEAFCNDPHADLDVMASVISEQRHLIVR